MKSWWFQSPVVGRVGLRIGSSPVEGEGDAEGLALAGVGGHELAVEAVQAAGEALRVVGGEARAQDGKGRPLVVDRGKHLLGHGTKGSRRDIADALAVCVVRALEEEQSRRASVVALGDRAYLSRSHDLAEPRLLQHLYLVRDGPIGEPERVCELACRVRALSEED